MKKTHTANTNFMLLKQKNFMQAKCQNVTMLRKKIS